MQDLNELGKKHLRRDAAAHTGQKLRCVAAGKLIQLFRFANSGMMLPELDIGVRTSRIFGMEAQRLPVRCQRHGRAAGEVDGDADHAVPGYTALLHRGRYARIQRIQIILWMLQCPFWRQGCAVGKMIIQNGMGVDGLCLPHDGSVRRAADDRTGRECAIVNSDHKPVCHIFLLRKK